MVVAEIIGARRLRVVAGMRPCDDAGFHAERDQVLFPAVSGVKINHRKYDDEALWPFRKQNSGVARRRGLWEIHYDPYDVSRIWVRDHCYGGWVTVPWAPTHRASAVRGDGLGPRAQAAPARTRH